MLEAAPEDVYSLNNMAVIALEHDKDPAKAFAWLSRAKEARGNHPLIRKNHQKLAALLGEDKATEARVEESP